PMGGDENAWAELGRATQILDNLIARGEAEPMIVVMTNGNVDMEGAPGETSLGFTPPTTQLPKTMEGTFERHFPDVVRYVDSNYRTIADKEHRAIAGLSMGGFHSLHISKEYPDMFDYVGLFSAAILPREGTVSPIYDNLDGKLAAQFADAPRLYWIAIGEKDFLYDANKDYRKMLDDKGYRYVYRESPDGHIWKNWRIYLTEFIPQLFKNQ
ncbi:MAG: esterase, partial [Muribaculaceae bacterium]|nr:esterase [Muribaculaceae bacterium]